MSHFNSINLQRCPGLAVNMVLSCANPGSFSNTSQKVVWTMHRSANQIQYLS